MDWLNEIPEQHRKSLKKVLEAIKDFPGLVAVVGSSINEKYLLGKDIDIVLVGYSKSSGLEYTNTLAKNLYEEYLANLQRLSNTQNLEDLKYPLIKEIRFDLEDPIISTYQEMVPGHGGSNISLELLPYPIGSLRMGEDYLTEYRSRKIGPNRSLIDLVIDYSFQENTDLNRNISHWKEVMEKNKRKYFILRE